MRSSRDSRTRPSRRRRTLRRNTARPSRLQETPSRSSRKRRMRPSRRRRSLCRSRSNSRRRPSSRQEPRSRRRSCSTRMWPRSRRKSLSRSSRTRPSNPLGTSIRRSGCGTRPSGWKRSRSNRRRPRRARRTPASSTSRTRPRRTRRTPGSIRSKTPPRATRKIPGSRTNKIRPERNRRTPASIRSKTRPRRTQRTPGSSTNKTRPEKNRGTPASITSKIRPRRTQRNSGSSTSRTWPRRIRRNSGKHHKQDAAKEDSKDSGKHHKQDTAKEDSKESGKHHKQDTAKENSKEVVAKQLTPLTQAPPAQTQTQPPALPPAQSQPVTVPPKAAQPVPAMAAPPIPTPPPIPIPPPVTPAQTDTTTTADTKPTAPADARLLETTVADAPSAQSAPSFDRPYGLGGPAQQASLSDDKPTKAADAKKLVDDRVQTTKPGERGGGIRIPSLPPVPDSYKQSELLLANPSREVLVEMKRRGYGVPVDGGSLMLVTLPRDAPPAWEVQRELEAKFPGQQLGLNFMYKPYHPQTGSKSAAPPLTRNEILSLIGWDEKRNLAACAVGVNVGMIDTLVDKRTHSTFADTHLETVNLALKHDAPPAPHWHGTGVLSVMAGLGKSGTAALIPGAEFTAVNVFFTNKDGQLETDTAHLTEALAYLGDDKKRKIQIINMSLVGPKDDLVHARIRRHGPQGCGLRGRCRQWWSRRAGRLSCSLRGGHRRYGGRSQEWELRSREPRFLH